MLHKFCSNMFYKLLQNCQQLQHNQLCENKLNNFKPNLPLLNVNFTKIQQGCNFALSQCSFPSFNRRLSSKTLYCIKTLLKPLNRQKAN